jgi:hypothetical protein
MARYGTVDFEGAGVGRGKSDHVVIAGSSVQMYIPASGTHPIFGIADVVGKFPFMMQSVNIYLLSLLGSVRQPVEVLGVQVMNMKVVFIGTHVLEQEDHRLSSYKLERGRLKSCVGSLDRYNPDLRGPGGWNGWAVLGR